MDRKKLNTLAEKIVDAKVLFDSKLHSKRRKFPAAEFNLLFDAVVSYTNCLGDENLLHRNVAREISGIREFLQLQEFKTPGSVLAKADRMETMVFSGYDPYFEGAEPPGL
ncbi:MAG: hypothetical protein V2B19_24815 [Pseudomonadota bacterium]